MYLTHFVVWYAVFSNTFKNRTIIPLAANRGHENSIVMGGLDQAFPDVEAANSASANKPNSLPPGKRLIRHTMAWCSGSYLALPSFARHLHRAVFLGHGILMTTF